MVLVRARVELLRRQVAARDRLLESLREPCGHLVHMLCGHALAERQRRELLLLAPVVALLAAAHEAPPWSSTMTSAFTSGTAAGARTGYPLFQRPVPASMPIARLQPP